MKVGREKEQKEGGEAGEEERRGTASDPFLSPRAEKNWEEESLLERPT